MGLMSLALLFIDRLDIFTSPDSPILFFIASIAGIIYSLSISMPFCIIAKIEHPE